jgi:tetratricopeptide (TPR) repeat protein
VGAGWSNFDEAHHQLGFVYLHIGLLDKAWSEIQKTLAIKPDNTMARYRLGVIHMCRGEYQDAFQFFNSTPLEQNPALLGFYKPNALFRLGRTEEASVLVDQVLKNLSEGPGRSGYQREGAFTGEVRPAARSGSHHPACD